MFLFKPKAITMSPHNPYSQNDRLNKIDYCNHVTAIPFKIPMQTYVGHTIEHVFVVAAKPINKQLASKH